MFRWAADQGYFSPPGDALVVGAGLLAEAIALANGGWRVDALETPHSLLRRPDLYAAFDDRPGCRVVDNLAATRRRYRVIVVTHVLEFIEDTKVRRDLVSELSQRLTSQGQVFISLRGWSDVRAAKRQWPKGDGIVTGLGTWTRGYSVPEAKALIESAGLVVSRTPSPRSKTPEQVRLVCQKR